MQHFLLLIILYTCDLLNTVLVFFFLILFFGSFGLTSSSSSITSPSSSERISGEPGLRMEDGQPPKALTCGEVTKPPPLGDSDPAALSFGSVKREAARSGDDTDDEELGENLDRCWEPGSRGWPGEGRIVNSKYV